MKTELQQQLRFSFGEAVRERRDELALKQADCAQRAKLSATSLSLIESGKKGVRFDVFWRLAYALELAPHELVRRVMPDPD